MQIDQLQTIGEELGRLARIKQEAVEAENFEVNCSIITSSHAFDQRAAMIKEQVDTFRTKVLYAYRVLHTDTAPGLRVARFDEPTAQCWTIEGRTAATEVPKLPQGTRI